MPEAATGVGSSAHLHLYIGGADYEIALDSTETSGSRPISETQTVGFEIRAPEENTEYRIRIGGTDADVSSSVSTSGAVVLIGQRFAKFVAWHEGAFFESARGRTSLFVESRPAGGTQWQIRSALSFVVVPSKLGELRFQRMLSDLTGLAAGLVLDLVSKSRVSLAFVSQPSTILAGSGQLELRALEASWGSISAAIRDIDREPATHVVRRDEVRRCWGSERLARRGLELLASTGSDVRLKNSSRPFTSIAQVTVEACTTVEHQRVAALLEILEERAHRCAQSAQMQIRAIERDRVFRQTSDGGQSLFEAIDQPRIRQLESALERAQALRLSIHKARQLSALRGVVPAPGPMNSPVFQFVQPYRRLRDAARAFERSTAVVLAEGDDEQLKSTSRMYEQWVLLQIVAAMRECGFRSRVGTKLFRSAGRLRYTLDIERGSQVEFRSRDGRIISIRYEPWILTKIDAKARRDTVFRGGQGTASWSPDILIEFMHDDAWEGLPNTVEYGVVVDAKYSRKVHPEQRDSVSKYLDIKSTRTDRQVVYQSWVAYPAADDGFSFPESDIEWTSDGPTLPKGDRAIGEFGLSPDESAAGALSSFARPNARAVEFVRGILSYLKFPESGAS